MIDNSDTLIQDEPIAVSWYPYAYPIGDESSIYGISDIEVTPYWLHGIDSFEYDTKKGAICVVSWGCLIDNEDVATWSIAFLPYDQCLKMMSDIKLAGHGGYRILAVIESQDVKRDIAELLKFYPPSPLYKNVVWIKSQQYQMELLEIVASSHLNSPKLDDLNNKALRLENDVFRLNHSVAEEKELNNQINRSHVALEKRTEKLSQNNIALQLENDELRREISKLSRKQDPKKNKGYVYILRVVEHDNLYKIGRTKNPDNRLKTFSVKLPFTVEFEAVIKTDDMYELERKLHYQYRNTRQRGSEFFILTPTDIENIRNQEAE